MSDNPFIVKIKEVGKALKCGCYHCALALALTIPDICGAVAYPNECSSGRYKKWFNEYVCPHYFLCPDEVKLPNEGRNILNGYACYLLCCAYLHSGDWDLKRQNPNIKISSFKLHYDKASVNFGSYNSFQTVDTFSLDIDVSGLCRAICQAATDFYYQGNNADLFEDNEIDNIPGHPPKLYLL